MIPTFEITHDREFLQHFLTRWRTLSLSSEMVEKLKENKGTDAYAAYGYGRWLSLVNPYEGSLKEAEILLIWAGTNGVQDANAALAQMYFDGRTETDKAMPQMHAFLMDSSYKLGSELSQYMTLENTIYGEYGFPKDPAQVVDILKGHIEKNPGCDPAYYELYGEALESSDAQAAEKAFRTSLERGNTESYYSLANLYRKQGDEARACDVAAEGARHGAVNCHRFKAGLDQEEFLKLSPRQQTAVHKEVAEGLDYAIAHNDRYACYLKGSLLYCGYLGYPESPAEALAQLERGCELGNGSCFWLKAAICHDEADSLPSQLRLSPGELAKTFLQAARMGDREQLTLEQIACGYVNGLLSKYDEEIEQLWLKEYVAANPEEEEGADSAGVLAVYPQGFYYAKDVTDESDMDFNADVVHFSPLLTRLTKALSYDKEGCHIAMLVEKDGQALDLPDNMTGTIVYGHGAEMRGIVIFALEDDKDYTLKPFIGIRHTWMFIQLLNAATGGLLRMPTSEELESIGAPDTGGYEEYDDPEVDEEVAGFEGEEEIEEDMLSADTSAESAESTEPKSVTVTSDKIQEGIRQCNLCRDTLYVTYPNTRDFWFKTTEDLFDLFGIKSAVEENISGHGGYMIDEWLYVDERQTPTDIRARVRFKPED